MGDMKKKKKRRNNKTKDVLVSIDGHCYHIRTLTGDYNGAAAVAFCENAIKLSETDPAASLEQFNIALRLNPDFLPAYNSRGILKVKTGDMEGALNDYNDGLLKDPAYGPIYYSRGLLKEDFGDIEGALADFAKAIECNVDTVSVFWQKGLMEEKLRLFDDALKDYTKALEIDPDEPLLYSNRGVVFDSLGFHKKALADYDKALELNPLCAQAHCNKGVLLSLLDNLKGAVKSLTRAVEIKEDFDWAYLNRGICYYKNDEYEKALNDFTKALKYNPEMSDALCFLGAAMIEKGEYNKALENLDKSLEINPSSMHAYFYKARIADKTGDKQEKINCLKKAFSLQIKNCNTLKKGNMSLFLYRKIDDNTIDALTHNYLWFSHPSQLNDPLDCRFYENITNDDDDMLKILKEVRVRCLSISNEAYNSLLWGHYADGSRGIEIEYELDIEKLVKSGIYLNKIEYSKALRPENTMPEYIDYGKSYFAKTQEWQYENEWRLITLGERLKDSHKLFDCFQIKSVTFGLETPEEQIKLIRSLVPEAKFYQFVCPNLISGTSVIKKVEI